MKDRINKNQQGSIVVYASILMMGASAIALTLSLVVLTAVKIGENTSDRTNAFYAAETGLEEALYQVKFKREQKIYALHNTLEEISCDGSILLANGDESYCPHANNTTATSLTFNLKKGQSKQIDLYDPDSAGSLFISGAGTANLSWTTKDCSEQPVEFSVKSFAKESVGQSVINPEDYAVTLPATSPYSYALEQNLSHIIKVKALGCDLKNARFWAADSNEDIIPLPNYITLESDGWSEKASIKLQASTIWKPPLSGLGDYVLFSEQSITK